MKETKRFTSEKSATSFASKVNGKVADLRENPVRKSNFKVSYEKGTIPKSNYDEKGYDFDSDLNMNGTNWHTAEDL